MKLLNLVTFLIVLILTFSGCLGNPKPSDTPVIDHTLPLVTLTATGTFVDMKAVAFEWNSIKDSRVQGIYVYKKALDALDNEYKFHHTVKNRFVTHYVDDDVQPQSKYSYYFKTFTKDSESKQSKEVTVETLGSLESISWIHVVQNMPKSAKIIWRPHTNQIVEKYLIERKTLEEDQWSELITINGRLYAEYIDSNLKDNFVYKYRIKVITYNGIISKASKEVKVLTKPLPQQIDKIQATDNLAKKIRVTWSKTNIKDFSHYNIYRGNSIDDNYFLLARTAKTELIDVFKEDGEDYFYRISAIDKDGLESNYETKSAHGKTLSKPLSPSLVEVIMVGDTLEISWSSTDARIKSYIVNKTRKKSWLNSISEEFLNIRATKFIDKAIEPSTTYFYEIFSVDEFSIKSQPSIQVKFTTRKNQGKLPSPKEKKSAPILRNISTPIEKKDVIQVMDDLDVSSL